MGKMSFLVILIILLIPGCISETSKVIYVCPDASEVSDKSECKNNPLSPKTSDTTSSSLITTTTSSTIQSTTTTTTSTTIIQSTTTTSIKKIRNSYEVGQFYANMSSRMIIHTVNGSSRLSDTNEEWTLNPIEKANIEFYLKKNEAEGVYYQTNNGLIRVVGYRGDNVLVFDE
jgi:cytoskeletal protein RodZ